MREKKTIEAAKGGGKLYSVHTWTDGENYRGIINPNRKKKKEKIFRVIACKSGRGAQ